MQNRFHAACPEDKAFSTYIDFFLDNLVYLNDNDDLEKPIVDIKCHPIHNIKTQTKSLDLNPNLDCFIACDHVSIKLHLGANSEKKLPRKWYK